MSRTNLVKYLAGKSSSHINTLTYSTRTIVVSKIEYGFFLVANSAKSALNLKSGLTSLETLYVNCKNQLLPKILSFNLSITSENVSKIVPAKRTPTVRSVLYNCVHNNIVNFKEKIPIYKPKHPA